MRTFSFGKERLGEIVLRAGQAPQLAVTEVAKSYGATVALERVSLGLRAGEVHALLGENGAGKSTLVKILSGVVRPNTGAMQLEGASYAPGSIRDAWRAGVATAFQELSLAPNLSVAKALMLPTMQRDRLGLVSPRRTAEAAAAILARYRLTEISPIADIASLSLAERQRLEIVRALDRADKVLVLDEPTAALPDVDWLFELIHEATAAGTAVLYISHRLGEVRSLCQRATVLRNGRSVAQVDLADASDSDIFELMVGRSETIAERRRSGRIEARTALAVRGLSGSKVRDVSFEVKQGEILGIAALDGQGQRELFRTLVGLERMKAGEIRVDGQPVHPKSPRAAIAQGLGFLPEERKTEGIFPTLATAANIVLPILQRMSRAGFVSPASEGAAAARSADAVELSTRYLGFRIAELSGGNQQKALLARVLATGARILLLYDPTRGVDVGTKQAIYTAIEGFAAGGGAVVLYSSELPELTRLADRCLVLYGAQVFAEFAGEDIEERALVAALTGHASAADAALSGSLQ
ncbi:sugar ABC transporter ATP-binding protein [Chelatococcus sp. GCM10030263]|uniref:sugar ABC transporter ATP-binding protein n=1 Tax=Chelatococcus sp. GCM10030263 TaxID=3273387 RepID=UPI0036124368